MTRTDSKTWMGLVATSAWGTNNYGNSRLGWRRCETLFNRLR